MATKPLDTTTEAWETQRRAIARMSPEERVRTAIELSEAVRELQLQGILARNPQWSRSDAVKWLLKLQGHRITDHS